MVDISIPFRRIRAQNSFSLPLIQALILFSLAKNGLANHFTQHKPSVVHGHLCLWALGIVMSDRWVDERGVV